MYRWTKIVLLVSFLLIAPPVHPQSPGITTISISDQVAISSVKRLGVNLGSINRADSGQIMKNLVFVANPGFGGQLYQSVVRCVSGSATSCVDDNAVSAWPAGFWNGARYEVIWGVSKGRAGTIVSSTAPSA